jgi:hypothetical protein
MVALRRLLSATRDTQAGQGSGGKDKRKYDKAILKGNDEGLLEQIAAQHRLDFGVQEFPHVASTLHYPL